MKRSPVLKNKQLQEKENIKILKEFFEKSSMIINDAIKESHRKYPDLFKSS